MPDRSEPSRTPPHPGLAEGSPEAGRDSGDTIAARAAQMLELGLAERDRRIEALEARLAERDRLGAGLRGRVTERGLYATWLESEVAQRDERLGTLAGEVAERVAEVDLVRAELASMRASRAWRLATALGRSVGRLRRLGPAASRLPGRVLRGLLKIGTPGGANPASAVRGTRPAEGSPADARSLELKAAEGASPGPASGSNDASPPIESVRDPNDILRFIPPRSDAYDEWLRNHSWNPARRAEADRELARLERRPSFSVLASVRGVDATGLRETLASLREQVYPDFEVILIGGSGPVTASFSGQPAAVGSEEGGEFEAWRSAAERASGEYLVLLDDRARLAPDALLELAKAAIEAAEPPDLIYADEDRVDAEGRRFAPRFRPGWSPEAMLSTLAIGRTFAVRRSSYAEVGGLRPEFEDAWRYDLVLRLAERPGPIVRVPLVLVHVSAERGAADLVDCSSTRSIALAARALSGALERRGIGAEVSQPTWAARERFPAFELDFPDRGPRVVILIPTKDRVDLLRRCVESILERTTYRDFEVVVLDNGSEDPETLSYLEHLAEPCRVLRIESEDGRFNYSRLHNRAISGLGDDVEYVVLLNNDTEVRRPEWLGQLVGFGGMAGVGAVGARLLFGDGRVQHAGMLTDLYDGVPGHAFKFSPWWDGGAQRLTRLARNVSAVTAACLLVRRSTFLDLGGFDEKRFAVGYNDVDFCLRLEGLGLRCVYAPRAELLHFEGASRGFEDDLGEAMAFRERWGGRVDPYHHPALAKRDERLGVCTRRIGPVGSIGDRAVRVLLDVDRLDGSGNARLVRRLSEGLRDRGLAEPEVRCRRDGPIGDLLRESGIRVEVEVGPQREDARRFELADRLSRGEFDLVHAVGLGRYGSIGEAGSAGVPALWSVRESVDFRDAFGELDDEEARAAIGAFSGAYRVVFPSWGVRRPFHPVESRWNFEVVPEVEPSPGVLPNRGDARVRLGLPASSEVIGCLVREGDESGGARDFLQAAAALIRSGRDVVALVIGEEGGAGSFSEDLGNSFGDRVRLVSAADSPVAALAAADLLVSCPRRDLDPGSISVGKSLGLPMVLSDVPGVDEYSRPGRSALVARPGDVDAIRDRIIELLDDRGARSRLALAGRFEAVRAGSFEEMLRAYDRLYREAVATGESREPGSWSHRLGAA